MPSRKTEPAENRRTAQAASIGQGHFVHVFASDGTWRVAMVDEWTLGDLALQAAFDAVHPDGSLDFCGDALGEGHLPVDLGRADRFFEARRHQCEAIDRLWQGEAGPGILEQAPERWRGWSGNPLPSLIRAKAAHRLFETHGLAFDDAGALTALTGALQENIEICAARSTGIGQAAQTALDAMDASALSARSAKRRPKAAAPKKRS